MDIFKIDVHIAWNRDNFCNTLGGNAENIIRLSECLFERKTAENIAQFII